MIDPKHVHETLARHQLADGMDVVVDLEKSHGIWLHDSRTGTDYLDAFSCFASWPIGYNHPMIHEADFVTELTRAAQTKLSNSDLYTTEMAAFVDAFATKVTPAGFPHHFWISGGALAVENSLKTAFDYKARKLGRTNFEDDVNDLVILHFKKAFHGRSGYTMSLTNTLPDKIGLFPKFNWPRVHSPAIEFDLDGQVANNIEAEESKACREIEAALAQYKNKIAGILIEPMQGEGGDNHFRKEFLAKLRQYADDNEALLIFDEIQTGFYGSGKTWLWQHYNVKPDVVCFGKKSQICGIFANQRVDEVQNNVFSASSRINSTWGGSLVDMVRCRRFIEIIETENLAENTAGVGKRIVDGLRSIAKDTGAFANVRGVGSLIAFTCEDAAARDAMLGAMMQKKVLALPSGPVSVRFRLSLVMNKPEADQLLELTAACTPTIAGA